VGERLAGRRFAALYASDLKRAFATAEAIGAKVGLEPQPSPALREIFLGEWEGLTTEDIANRHPEAWAAWVEEPDWDVVPGGEGAALFDARVGAALDEIFQRHQHRDVLVVTHGGVIQVALHRIVGRPPQGLFPFKIQNASISLIEQRNGRMVIGGVNDVAHLEKALVTEVGPG
jgi:broad specificity phosphatase PhoE